MAFVNNKNVLVFSVALGGYASLYRNCISSQKSYCAKHGFKYILVDKAPRQLSSGEAAWLKVFLLNSALKNSFRWVAFLDADCEIRTHAPSFVEEFETTYKGKGIFMAQGFSGRLNSGVIFMKNIPEAINFLEQVITNGNKEIPKEDRAPHENGHMHHYGKVNNYLGEIDGLKWNNNRNLNPESYIQHFSGGKLRKFYIKQHPFLNVKYLLKRGIRKTAEYIFKRPGTANVKEIESILLPFYKEFFSEFGEARISD